MILLWPPEPIESLDLLTGPASYKNLAHVECDRGSSKYFPNAFNGLFFSPNGNINIPSACFRTVQIYACCVFKHAFFWPTCGAFRAMN